MKILFVFGFSPYPANSGGIIRAYNLIKGLAGSHEIHLHIYSPWEVSREAQAHMLQFCKTVQVEPAWTSAIVDELMKKRICRVFNALIPGFFFNKNVQRLFHPVAPQYYGLSHQARDALMRALAREKFHIAHFEFLSVAHYVNYAYGLPTILGTQNIESLIIRQYSRAREVSGRNRLAKYIWSKRLGRFEASICKKFTKVVAVSDEDRAALKAMTGRDDIAVVPNGVDPDFFAPSERGSSHETNSIVFTGSLHYPPNDDAVMFFIGKVFPIIKRSLPKVQFHIVGRDPSPRILYLPQWDSNIKVYADVEDIRPYMERGKVYVVPLRIGGGTRLKILEALALKKAVVSTTLGSQGLNLKPDVHLLVADEPEDFANKVVKLMETKELRMRLGEEGRRLVELDYNWRHSCEKLEAVYEEALSKEGARRANVWSG